MMLDNVRAEFIFNLSYYLLKPLFEPVFFANVVQGLVTILDQFGARTFVSAIWVLCFKVILESEE